MKQSLLIAVAMTVLALSSTAGGWAASAAPAGTCEVTTTADSGAGSLRECLAGALAEDVITFDPAVFPPETPATIHVTSALPALTSGHVTIDAEGAGVIVDGSATTGEHGLAILSDYNRVSYLEISSFDDHCVYIDGSENEIEYSNVLRDCETGAGITGSGSGNNHVIGNWVLGCHVGIRIAPLEPYGEFHSARGNWIGLEYPMTPNPNDIGILVTSGEGTRMPGNIIAYNGIGVRVEGDATLDPGADDLYNCLRFNGVGLSHAGTAIDLRFEKNWWNSADGPSGVGPGSGDSIEEVGTGTVDYEPFLRSGYHTSCGGEVVFRDDFESGDWCQWSNPGPSCEE